MTDTLADQVLARVARAAELYHRLVLLVAPSGSGKTAALRAVADRSSARLVNVNLEVSRRLLEVPAHKRPLQFPGLLGEVMGAEDVLLLLDNIEILFDVALQQDPLRLLQGISRNHTVVAAWNGRLDGDHITYATPEHPEHRRYPRGDLMVVCAEAGA